ncbi:MAG: hypothetical protein ACRDVM_00225 [Acidimicrobiia bacterium]
MACAASALLLVTAVPARGDDLSEFLERRDRAEFRGEQVVTCTTPEGTIDAVLDVRQRDGVAYAGRPSGEGHTVAVADGTLSVAYPDGSADATTVTTGHPTVELSARYQTGAPEAGRYLGREVDTVEIQEADLVRARLDFDRETGALLRFEVFNGDGSTYCVSRFVNFTPGEPEIPRVVIGSEAIRSLDEQEAPAHPMVLPEELAGFRRLDVYGWSEDTVLAYYTDGLFSFTVLHSLRPVEIPEMADAKKVESGRRSYLRMFAPGQVVYAWESTDGGFALFGDLPLDQQEAVLAELPEPGGPGFLVRIWRKLFR